ncbi:hypothetical protein AUTU_37420 [Aureibacter tunicatorum]|nr:hypothetical protein AUTU_37420 [Aureibacter tunicatorum]
MVLVFGVLVVIGLLIASSFYFYQSRQILKDTIKEQLNPAMSRRMDHLINNIFIRIEDFGKYGMYENYYLINALAQEEVDTTLVMDHLDAFLATQVHSQLQIADLTHNIMFSTDNGITKLDEDTQMVQTVQDKLDGRYGKWNITVKDGKEILELSHIIMDKKTDSPLGIFFFQIDWEPYKNYFTELDIGGNNNILIMKRDGQIIIDNFRKNSGKNFRNIEGMGQFYLEASTVNNRHEGGRSDYEFNGEEKSLSYFPLRGGEWVLLIDTSITELLNPLSDSLIGMWWIAMGIIIISIILVAFFSNKFSANLHLVTQYLDKLSSGKILQDTSMNIDILEFNKIANSFHNMNERVKKYVNFTHRIGKGDMDAALEVSENDELGHSLIDMRNSLLELKNKDEIQKWIDGGLARFAELIRKEKQDISILSDSIIKELVEYIGSNQGMLFVIDDLEDDSLLTLKGCYAFGKKKHLDKQVKPGEGLVGQCFLEKQMTLITEIPESYYKITSGLGEALPSHILLVPIKIDNQVLGVIEIASFKDFEEYKLQFIERLCEMIASSISMVKINEKTMILLQDSQRKSEELRGQEEEIRQNMEELLATQEDFKRKEIDYLKRIEELETSLQTKNATA